MQVPWHFWHSRKPEILEKIIELHMKTKFTNHSVYLATYTAIVVHTATNDITLFWCPCTSKINSKIYFIDLATSNLSLCKIIGLPADLLFHDFVAIVPLSYNSHVKVKWTVNQYKESHTDADEAEKSTGWFFSWIVTVKYYQLFIWIVLFS